MSRPLSPVLVLLALMGLVGATPAVACSCHYILGPEGIRQAVRKSEFVFRGRVIKVEPLDPVERRAFFLFGERTPLSYRFIATFAVSAVWKGQLGHTLNLYDLHQAGSGGLCFGLNAQVGQEYLVFANSGQVRRAGPNEIIVPNWTDKLPEGQTIIISVPCSYSSKIADADETLRVLGQPKP